MRKYLLTSHLPSAIKLYRESCDMKSSLAENRRRWFLGDTVCVIIWKDHIDVRVPRLWKGLSCLMLNVWNAPLFKFPFWCTIWSCINRPCALFSTVPLLMMLVMSSILIKKERHFSFMPWTTLFNRPHINLNVCTQKM